MVPGAVRWKLIKLLGAKDIWELADEIRAFRVNDCTHLEFLLIIEVDHEDPIAFLQAVMFHRLVIFFVKVRVK